MKYLVILVLLFASCSLNTINTYTIHVSGASCEYIEADTQFSRNGVLYPLLPYEYTIHKNINKVIVEGININVNIYENGNLIYNEFGNYIEYTF